MGCGSTKEKLQTDILVLQLEKAEIQEERERLIYQLQLITHKKDQNFYHSFLKKYSKTQNQQKSISESTE